MLLTRYQDLFYEAGCDEAGRGCLAGPVFAAAVILPANFKHPLLNDSKQMKATDRDKLRKIIEKKAICYAVASVDNVEIDKINILKASFKAMHLALDQLVQRPEYILVDGNRFTPYGDIPYACIIEGDGKYASIAAASVLAKTYRDEYMQQLHQEHPHFGWDTNMGYGTKKHREAIQVHGETSYHRKSFRLLPEQLELDL
ncbi:ribonuclease HII [Chitinophaga sp. Cy-1792]|uniref:ribonuclease HII n=1 Tax=Chitinophaga sp. Cy-1792 TaxID=2608339 RepID=UPI00141F1ED1|nr:ribonuclease HII [Chitinophaga sp. Cy-1792]NIG52318.1 ribonuclease HII [Chitinophaga sp. Cy-1792]